MSGAATSETAPGTVRYQDTLKPAPVETLLDAWFFRPVAWGLVKLALPTPLSANGMTFLSILCGLAASGMLLAPDRRVVIAGSLLMVLYGVLDCADGQLARARGTASRIGRILDGVSDYVVGAASGLIVTWLIWQAHGPRGL
ncbi:MAG: CDP-alcohol phosphatidyltransferase family protein, partial [Planctomycetota bacterium]